MCPGTHKSLLFWDTSLQGLEAGVLQAEAVPAVAVHGPETPQEPGGERIPRERPRRPACTTQHRQEKRQKMLPKQTHPIFRSAQQKAKLKAPQGTRAAYQKNLPLWHNHGHKWEHKQIPCFKGKRFCSPFHILLNESLQVCHPGVTCSFIMHPICCRRDWMKSPVNSRTLISSFFFFFSPLYLQMRAICRESGAASFKSFFSSFKRTLSYSVLPQMQE